MEAKDKILDKLKDIKDNEITDGVTTLAAEYIEREGSLLDRVAGSLTNWVRELLDDLPKRVKWGMKILGVSSWIDDMLTKFEERAAHIVAKELRDFSKPETAG